MKPPPAFKQPPPRRRYIPGPRFGFEPYREIAMDFFRKIFNQHYTDMVITDDSMLHDYTYISIEGMEHRFSSYDAAMQTADNITRAKVMEYFGVYLDSAEVLLYDVFEQIRLQRLNH